MDGQPNSEGEDDRIDGEGGEKGYGRLRAVKRDRPGGCCCVV